MSWTAHTIVINNSVPTYVPSCILVFLKFSNEQFAHKFAVSSGVREIGTISNNEQYCTHPADVSEANLYPILIWENFDETVISKKENVKST